MLLPTYRAYASRQQHAWVLASAKSPVVPATGSTLSAATHLATVTQLLSESLAYLQAGSDYTAEVHPNGFAARILDGTRTWIAGDSTSPSLELTVDMCNAVAQIASTMLSKYKPMLVPPRPWLSASKGGHLTLATPVVRLAAGSRQQLHALQAVDKRMVAEQGGGAIPGTLASAFDPLHDPLFPAPQLPYHQLLRCCCSCRRCCGCQMTR